MGTVVNIFEKKKEIKRTIAEHAAFELLLLNDKISTEFRELVYKTVQSILALSTDYDHQILIANVLGSSKLTDSIQYVNDNLISNGLSEAKSNMLSSNLFDLYDMVNISNMTHIDLKLYKMMVYDIFMRMPLTYLKFDESEWVDHVSGNMENNRCYKIFKKPDGTIIDIGAIIWLYNNRPFIGIVDNISSSCKIIKKDEFVPSVIHVSVEKLNDQYIISNTDKYKIFTIQHKYDLIYQF